MNRGIEIVLIAACCCAIPLGARAQSAPPSAPDNSQQQKQPADKKPANPQKPAGNESNPFPEDTTTVPVVPTNAEPAALAGDSSTGDAAAKLPGADSDPVRSPDDPEPEAEGSDSGFSSSLTGVDELKPPPDAEKTGKHKGSTDETIHQETAPEDVNVGNYYLERKNWKAALSRFEAALVLAPENPEIYWGLAEAERELGDFAKAKSNYMKVMEYDPDSKHAKEAKKLLKEPELASAKAAQ